MVWVQVLPRCHVIAALGDDNIVTATGFGHPEGRRYTVAAQEILELPDVSLANKKKMMWDNALRLYPFVRSWSGLGTDTWEGTARTPGHCAREPPVQSPAV